MIRFASQDSLEEATAKAVALPTVIAKTFVTGPVGKRRRALSARLAGAIEAEWESLDGTIG